MPWGKKKSYNLVQSTNKQKKALATNGFYTKGNSSSSTSSSKGLMHKSNVPKQVKIVANYKKYFDL